MTSRAIVTTCDAGFLDGSEALLRSARGVHPDVTRYCFVPHEDLEVCWKRLGKLGDIRCFPRKLKGVPEKLQVNAGRVFASTVPEERVVYLDADIVVCGSIDEFWNVSGQTVAAVKDSSETPLNNLSGANAEKYSKAFPEVCSQKGHNGGAWGINTSSWRDLPERFEDVLEKVGLEYTRIIDQPILNSIFQPDIKWLPFKFNAHCLFDHRIPKDIRVIHFTSSSKPWMPTFPKHEPAYWYWLKYGLPQAGRMRLLAAKLWIIVNTPKRLLGKRLKRGS